MLCMVDIICFLTICINNSLHCRTNLGFITPCQTGLLHGQVYMSVILHYRHVYYCYDFYVIIQYYLKVQPCHFKADELFNKITYYYNF